MGIILIKLLFYKKYCHKLVDTEIIIIYDGSYFLFDIMYTLINGFSLTYGLVSFFLNPAFPYPGNDFIITLFLFNI